MKLEDTLYFRKENILEIVLGVHRTNKLIQQELKIETVKNNLTPNELLTLIEIKKGYKKKTELTKKLLIKKQNLNLIFQSLIEKKFISYENKNTVITSMGIENLDKTVKKITEKVITIFKNNESKNMTSFINIIGKI